MAPRAVARPVAAVLVAAYEVEGVDLMAEAGAVMQAVGREMAAAVMGTEATGMAAAATAAARAAQSVAWRAAEE